MRELKGALPKKKILPNKKGSNKGNVKDSKEKEKLEVVLVKVA